MTKINETNINKYKGIMKKALAERYTCPEQVTKPLFMVQNIVSYDDYIDDVVYTPYVSVCTDLMLNGYFDSSTPNGLMALMIAIVSHADKEGFAFPSVERLAEMTGLSKRTVIDYIKTYANNSIKGRVLFYKQTIKRGKGQYDINMYYIPETVVVFTEEQDLLTEEQKLKMQNDNNAFEMPDIVLDEVEENEEFNTEKEPETVEESEAFNVQTIEAVTAVEAVTTLPLETKPDAVTGVNKNKKPETVTPETATPVLSIVEKIRAKAEEKAKDSSLTSIQKDYLYIDAENDAVEALFESLGL